jgi:hypothetical protein
VLPQRVAAVQGNRLIILHPQQIIFAEAERNTVWLTTDRGRIRARGRGLERLVSQLHDKDFVRVHRHFVVNARRIREVKHGFRGQLSLVMGPGSRKAVPVSRRRAAAVRRALELLFRSHLLHDLSEYLKKARSLQPSSEECHLSPSVRPSVFSRPELAATSHRGSLTGRTLVRVSSSRRRCLSRSRMTVSSSAMCLPIRHV